MAERPWGFESPLSHHIQTLRGEIRLMADDTIESKDVRDTGIDVAVEVGDGWSRRLTITVAPERVSRARAREREPESSCLWRSSDVCTSSAIQSAIVLSFRRSRMNRLTHGWRCCP